jgi:predicted protein tyrosine phosphatase
VRQECRVNQALGKRFKEFKAAPLVRVSQCAARHEMTHPNVIKAAALGVQTQHQIAQAFAPCKLRVAHANEVTPRSKALCPTVRVVAINQVLEMRKGHESKQLRKHGLTFIHATTSFKKSRSILSLLPF